MSGFEPRLPRECWAARTRDSAILKASSSGGVFTELARKILDGGGAVAGAAWDQNTWQVVHRIVYDEADLAELRGSKYVFSRFAGVCAGMEKCLAEGRTILFSGVPCQVAAIRQRFRDAHGLLTCGIICHSGSDEKIWLRYVAEVEKKAKSRLTDVRFRDKTEGWMRGRVALEFENPRRNVSMPFESCPYVKSFLEGYAARKVCLSCRFRSGRAGMDILLGDFWGIGNHFPDWADDRGASAVMVYTQRGRDLWHSLDIEKRPVEYAQILDRNPMLEQPVLPNPEKRKIFLEHVEERGVEKALSLALPIPWHRRAEAAIRPLIRKIKGLLQTKSHPRADQGPPHTPRKGARER